MSPLHPVHVVARVTRPWRRNQAYPSIRRALERSLSRGDFRIIALVVRKRRLELVVEADSALALARGMQGFQVAAARHWNRSCGRTGAVFLDRYRPLALRTRGEVRAAVSAMRITRRLVWPATYLLQIELVPFVTMDWPTDPDP